MAHEIRKNYENNEKDNLDTDANKDDDDNIQAIGGNEDERKLRRRVGERGGEERYKRRKKEKGGGEGRRCREQEPKPENIILPASALEFLGLS